MRCGARDRRPVGRTDGAGRAGRQKISGSRDSTMPGGKRSAPGEQDRERDQGSDPQLAGSVSGTGRRSVPISPVVTTSSHSDIRLGRPCHDCGAEGLGSVDTDAG